MAKDVIKHWRQTERDLADGDDGVRRCRYFLKIHIFFNIRKTLYLFVVFCLIKLLLFLSPGLKISSIRLKSQLILLII